MDVAAPNLDRIAELALQIAGPSSAWTYTNPNWDGTYQPDQISRGVLAAAVAYDLELSSLWDRLAADTNPRHAALVAVAGPGRHLEQLCGHHSPLVREAAAQHPQVSAAGLDAISAATHPEHEERVLLHIARNARCTETLLTSTAGQLEELDRFYGALLDGGHIGHGLPDHILRRRWVRTGLAHIAIHLNCPPVLERKLRNDNTIATFINNLRPYRPA